MAYLPAFRLGFRALCSLRFLVVSRGEDEVRSIS